MSIPIGRLAIVLASVVPAIAGMQPGLADPANICRLAQSSGTPQIPGLNMVYLSPLGDPAAASHWTYIIIHQTGPF